MQIKQTILRAASLGLVVGALAIPTTDEQHVAKQAPRKTVKQALTDVEQQANRVAEAIERKQRIETQLQTILTEGWR